MSTKKTIFKAYKLLYIFFKNRTEAYTKQIKMKSVTLKEVFNYKDTDKWLAEELSATLLMTTIKFVSFEKHFIKVINMFLSISHI